MADSFSKKENKKKKIQKQKEKNQRREERKANNDKGKSLEDMFFYVDAYGNLTKEKPLEKLEVDASEISLVPPTVEQETTKTGIVSFTNEKGYGFIVDSRSQESLFYHQNNCSDVLKKGNKVSFEIEKTDRGNVASNIKLIK